MGRGWRIATVAGIDIYLHWTFLLVPLLVFFGNIGQGPLAVAQAVALITAVFACVVLHELGHALMARQFGVGTRDIILLPIGGVARLDRMPEKPLQELAIAVAGPAVNVVIAIGLLALLAVTGSLSLLLNVSLVGQSFLITLLAMNVFLVLFNMLPAFPMDGGRVLRSILAMFLPFAQATRLAARVGLVMAVLLVLAGILLPQFTLILIGIFVFFVGRAEAQAVQMREWMRQQQAVDLPLPPGAIVFFDTRFHQPR